ncbi:hypothetical protein JOF56_010019 [Kibdelosporangium banguiense]|uniref:Uncharacterized protein n=1 Tax=Kibdelosporangium banguiense TaxID=1365924 RepID=A0ABS4U084_9PSEU|nr:hypothetical protein [Kibdelosporangium banguiense]MBP2329634.1 hypothetical protein [Kibdelosporangium banguiense]
MDGSLRPPLPIRIAFWLNSTIVALSVLVWIELLFAWIAVLWSIRESRFFGTPERPRVYIGFQFFGKPVDKRQYLEAGLLPDGFVEWTSLLTVRISVLFLGLVALGVLVLVKMRAGRNWARVVLVVLTAFGAIGSVVILLAASSGWVTLAGPAQWLLTVFALIVCLSTAVLLWLPVSAAFFQTAQRCRD